MSRVSVLVALLLTACGGRPSPASDWNGAEDIEVPWSNTRAPAAEIGAPEGAEQSPDQTRSARSQSKRGALIDFDVKDTDLHDAFTLLAESADINIVVADTVSGRITLRVRQVSWRQILQTLADMKQLTLSQEGNIYYVR